MLWTTSVHKKQMSGMVGTLRVSCTSCAEPTKAKAVGRGLAWHQLALASLSSGYHVVSLPLKGLLKAGCSHRAATRDKVLMERRKRRWWRRILRSLWNLPPCGSKLTTSLLLELTRGPGEEPPPCLQSKRGTPVGWSLVGSNLPLAGEEEAAPEKECVTLH